MELLNTVQQFFAWIAKTIWNLVYTHLYLQIPQAGSRSSSNTPATTTERSVEDGWDAYSLPETNDDNNLGRLPYELPIRSPTLPLSKLSHHPRSGISLSVYPPPSLPTQPSSSQIQGHQNIRRYPTSHPPPTPPPQPTCAPNMPRQQHCVDLPIHRQISLYHRGPPKHPSASICHPVAAQARRPVSIVPMSLGQTPQRLVMWYQE
ncbi:hypothetical protein BKA56DRAFT_659688 [Ilyonectria sp. MPI-CAGE-AT-0026]|nr:hypothetical protein BKA56DRAFT_659688 [Ilyonectria sp. MPI-CAGE-AT-0026]